MLLSNIMHGYPANCGRSDIAFKFGGRRISLYPVHHLLSPDWYASHKCCLPPETRRVEGTKSMSSYPFFAWCMHTLHESTVVSLPPLRPPQVVSECPYTSTSGQARKERKKERLILWSIFTCHVELGGVEEEIHSDEEAWHVLPVFSVAFPTVFVNYLINYPVPSYALAADSKFLFSNNTGSKITNHRLKKGQGCTTTTSWNPTGQLYPSETLSPIPHTSVLCSNNGKSAIKVVVENQNHQFTIIQ